MGLVVSNAICEAEFGEASVPEAHVEPLKRSCVADFAAPIKGDSLPKDSRLLKVSTTLPEGARRLVRLLAVADGTLFLLVYRKKGDPVGATITIRNPAFKKPLRKHLAMLQADLERGAFEVWVTG